MVRNIDALSRGWGNPDIIPAETYMWHFAGDGVSADNVNLILTNNSAVDGITFDWAVPPRDDVGAPCLMIQALVTQRTRS